MTITNMMQQRAALDATLDAIPPASAQAFEEIFDRKWQIEQTILESKAITLDELKRQIAILAERACDVGDAVADDLARLAK